jgi:hypothetical protein
VGCYWRSLVCCRLSGSLNVKYWPVLALRIHCCSWWTPVSCYMSLFDFSLCCYVLFFLICYFFVCLLFFFYVLGVQKTKTKLNSTPWPTPVSELNRLSDHRLSAKLVPTFADRGCHVVSVRDTYSRILGFLDQSRYFFFQVAPQLYSWGWVDPVPHPLLFKKSGSTGNRTRTSGSVARNSALDHRGGCGFP